MGENLTVRVTGRWRRRRPAWSGQPILVVEASGRRHRFPAMPEPPSLTGAGPGTWRLSFAVPAVLAPELASHAWLQFGAVVVQLPAAVEPPPGGGPPDVEDIDVTVSEPGPSGHGRRPSSELEIEGLRRRAREAEEAAAELTERVQMIEAELEAARIEAERLSGSLAERDAARRGAEQRAHAEQALRRDLARQLTARREEGARVRDVLGELAAAEDRIRTLESELRVARRRGDEAEQLAAAAVAARERVERRAHDTERARLGEHDRLRFEQDLVVRRAGAAGRIPTEPAAAPLPRVPNPSGAVPLASGAVPSPAMSSESASPEAAPPESVSPGPGPGPAGPRPGPGAPAAVGPPPLGWPSGPPAAAGQDALVGALRREVDARAGAEAALRSRLIDAEARLAARPLIDRRTESTLGLVRHELEGLRSALERERAARIAAEMRVGELSREASGRRERSQQTYDAISELRRALDALRAAPPPAEPAEPTEPAAAQSAPAEPADDRVEPAAAQSAPADPADDRVEPDRLNDARVRLRETIAPQAPAEEPPGDDAEPAPGLAEPGSPPEAGAHALTPVQRTDRAWLAPVFRALARTDAEGAGRLLLELLPAQQEAFPDPVAYDLVLGDPYGCVRVTAREGATVVRRAGGPRPESEVDFQMFGDPAAIARRLTAGTLRRLLRRRLARVSGRRDRVAALRSLLDLRLDLADLSRAGVRLEPDLMLKVLALAIEPGWTVRERFTLACSVNGGQTAYLLVRDGQRPEVADEAPAGRVATTISGSAEALAAVLSGDSGDPVTVTGDEWPLALLRKWIKRAQSD